MDVDFWVVGGHLVVSTDEKCTELGGRGGHAMLLSLRAYAKHRGCRLSAVQKAIKTGRIQKSVDGLLDVDQADASWHRNTDPAKQSVAKLAGRPASFDTAGDIAEGRRVIVEPEPQPHGGWLKRERAVGEDEGDDQAPDSFLEAKRRKEWIAVERSELDLKKERGELVELAPINAFVAGMILKARDELMRIAPELRDRLAQETDPNSVEEMVKRRVAQALNALAEYGPVAA